MPISMLLLLAVPLLYATIVVYFILLLLRKPAIISIDTAFQKLPGISIVVPFRNEADNLSRLIDSLDAQTYTGDFEILLVNDGSADRYNEAIGSHSRSRNRPLPRLRVIDSHYTPYCQLTSKQQALDYGINEAEHEWIALTDADMVLSPTWLETLIKQTAGGAKLIFGHTAVLAERKKPFFTWLQSFQLETLFSFAYVIHRARITGSCMGNNMLLSKEAFIAIGGFESTGYSIVEDRDILAAFRRKKVPVASTEPFFPTAFTVPCKSIKPFLHQLLRWAHGGFRASSNLSLFGALLAVHTVFFLIAAIGIFPLYLSVIIAVNQLLTWLFIFVSFGKLRSKENALLFPLFYAVFLVEAFFICTTLIIKKPVIWKERKI